MIKRLFLNIVGVSFCLALTSEIFEVQGYDRYGMGGYPSQAYAPPSQGGYYGYPPQQRNPYGAYPQNRGQRCQYDDDCHRGQICSKKTGKHAGVCKKSKCKGRNKYYYMKAGDDQKKCHICPKNRPYHYKMKVKKGKNKGHTEMCHVHPESAAVRLEKDVLGGLF